MAVLATVGAPLGGPPLPPFVIGKPKFALGLSFSPRCPDLSLGIGAPLRVPVVSGRGGGFGAVDPRPPVLTRCVAFTFSPRPDWCFISKLVAILTDTGARWASVHQSVCWPNVEHDGRIGGTKVGIHR